MSGCSVGLVACQALRHLGLLCGLGVASLALVELAVVTVDVVPRRGGPMFIRSQVDDPLFADETYGLRVHPEWLWEPRPGGLVAGEPVNEDGYRGPRYPQARGEGLRIAVLGGSDTYGRLFAEQDTWPRRLEALLRGRGLAVEVLNFGVDGFTLEQGLPFYHGRVRAYRPDVVLALFGSADESSTPPAGRSDIERIERLRASQGRMACFLERFAVARLVRGERRFSPSSCRVHPRRFGELVARLCDAVRQDGAEIVLVSPPHRADAQWRFASVMAYPVVLFERAQQLAVVVANAELALCQHDVDQAGGPITTDEQAARSELFLDVWVPSPKGHERIAAAVADALIQADLLHRRR